MAGGWPVEDCIDEAKIAVEGHLFNLDGVMMLSMQVLNNKAKIAIALHRTADLATVSKDIRAICSRWGIHNVGVFVIQT